MTSVLFAPSRGLGSQPLAGTPTLVRLALRRERIQLAAWLAGISVAVIGTLSALSELYPLESERAGLAAGVAANPALLVLTGPVSSTSIGGLTAWRIGILGAVLASLMTIFTVIRRTRTDEEAGRTELLASAVVGRASHLASALITAIGACLLLVVLIGAVGTGLGQDAQGSFALGVALAGPGLVFAGIAAVAAQLVENARTARAISGAALGAAFALRAVGDVAPDSLGALTWLSPLGWTEKLAAFAANNWAVAALFLAAGGLGIATALHLLVRRDVGLAMYPARLGRPTNPALRSPLSLAVRLQRGPLIGWTIGFAVFGAMAGGIAQSAQDLVKDNPRMVEMMRQVSGMQSLTDVFLAALGGMAGLLAGLYSISAALRMSSEETGERAAPVLATSVSRPQWMVGHLLFAFAGPAILLLTGGVIAGLLHSARTGDLATGMQSAMSALLAPLPAAWVMGGLAVAIYGFFPNATAVAWGALAVALLVGQLGPLLQLPTAIINISPYSHIGTVPATAPNWMALAMLTAAAAALVAVGVAGFRRRDLAST